MQGTRLKVKAGYTWFCTIRRHCIRNRHDSLLDITAWPQENFQKSLSLNTVHVAIHKCKLKLYQINKKPYVNTIQKYIHLLLVKAHLKWSEAKNKTVLLSDESNFFILFGNYGHHVLLTKKKKGTRNIQLVMSGQLKSLYPWWNGVPLLPMAWTAYTSGKAPSMPKRT